MIRTFSSQPKRRTLHLELWLVPRLSVVAEAESLTRLSQQRQAVNKRADNLDLVHGFAVSTRPSTFLLQPVQSYPT